MVKGLSKFTNSTEIVSYDQLDRMLGKKVINHQKYCIRFEKNSKGQYVCVVNQGGWTKKDQEIVILANFTLTQSSLSNPYCMTYLPERKVLVIGPYGLNGGMVRTPTTKTFCSTRDVESPIEEISRKIRLDRVTQEDLETLNSMISFLSSQTTFSAKQLLVRVKEVQAAAESKLRPKPTAVTSTSFSQASIPQTSSKSTTSTVAPAVTSTSTSTFSPRAPDQLPPRAAYTSLFCSLRDVAGKINNLFIGADI